MTKVPVRVIEDAGIGVARFLYVHVVNGIACRVEAARRRESFPVFCGAEIDVVPVVALGTPINKESGNVLVENPFRRLSLADIGSGWSHQDVAVISYLPVDEVFALQVVEPSLAVVGETCHEMEHVLPIHVDSADEGGL